MWRWDVRKAIIALILTGLLALATAVPAFASNVADDAAVCIVPVEATASTDVFVADHVILCRVDPRPPRE